MKVPNDTYNVENVQGEMKRYEDKFQIVQDVVNSAENVLDTESTAVIDERIALNEWQRMKVRYCRFLRS